MSKEDEGVRGLTRRAMILGLGAAGAALSTPALPAAPAVLKGAGTYRSIAMVNQRTGEWLKTVYWIDGAYVPEAMDAVNHIMRDWREDLTVRIDPKLLDILSVCHKRMECSEPYELVSGYRSPQTNAMLRRRSRGVARNSYHLKGMAADITMKSRTIRQMSLAGKSLGLGGVGTYSRRNFVHLDSGPVRAWGR